MHSAINFMRNLQIVEINEEIIEECPVVTSSRLRCSLNAHLENCLTDKN